MFRTLAAATLAISLPLAANAAGSSDDSPPTPTETTTSCEGGLIWDAGTKTCVAPKDSRLDDDARYEAVREFAYAGQYGAAQAAMDAMSDQQEDRVLTYRGFVTRKSGDMEGGMVFYRAAIDANPDNLLVRSYMGQAFVERGLIMPARTQLEEIRARGGAGGWSEIALAAAIEQGKGFSY